MVIYEANFVHYKNGLHDVAFTAYTYTADVQVHST